MSDMDDDDTHVCLKCRATIIGLDNYVAHRKSGCCSKQTAVIAQVAATPEERKEDVEDPSQRADDFFSCLELQSSAKKSPIPAGKTRGKTTSGEFSAQGEFLMEGTSDADVSDSCLIRSSGKNLNLSEKHNMSIVNGIHLGVSVEEDDSNDDYGVEYGDLGELDDAHGDYPPRSHTGGKWSRDLITSPPGDWGLMIDDCRGDTPPPNFTGGKWKPSPPVSSALDVDHTHHQMNQVSRDLHSDEDDDEAQAPPPGHTSGKWVPGKRPPMADITQQADTSADVWCEPCQRRLSSVSMYGRHMKSERHIRNTAHDREDVDVPPDVAARPARAKRTVRKPQHYFDTDTWVTKPRTTRVKNGRKQQERGKSPQSKWRWRRKEEDVDGGGDRAAVDEVSYECELEKTSYECECCGCEVAAGRLGEHLLSVAHYCNMQASGRWDLLLDNMASVVRLAPFQCALCRFYCNSADVFRDHWRSPAHVDVAAKVAGRLSCSACKFEAGDADEMGRHVADEAHAAAAAGDSGPAVVGRKSVLLECVDCGRGYRYNMLLRRHLARSGHRPPPPDTLNLSRHACPECHFVGGTSVALRLHVAATHRKVAVSGRRFFCGMCRRRFATSVEATRHRSSTEHRDARRGGVTKTCPVCGAVLGDLQQLRDHMRAKHADCPFRCSICGKGFALPQEVTNHVKRKECTFRTRQDHDQMEDSDENSSSSSRRDTAAKDETTQQPESSKGENADQHLQCKDCLYKAKLKSELLFHECLHKKPVMKPVSVNDRLTMMPMYSCTVCERYFRKTSLRDHIRCHTQEKLHACRECGQKFTFKSTLLAHMRKVHRVDCREFRCAECNYSTDLRTSIVRHRLTHTKTEKLLSCDTCKKKFAHRHNLKQHIRLHAGKQVRCPVEGCCYECRCQGELRNHLQWHSDRRPYPCTECDFRSKSKYQLARHMMIHRGEKPFSCPHCDFTTRLSSQLRRHSRVHTGARPYRCPYCDYRCNVLENLRKHVLTTRKHAGKKLYECRFCEDDAGRFATNLVKSFRVHLFTAHKDAFQSQRKAMSYITGIYHDHDDPLHVDNPLPAQPKWRRTRRNDVEEVKKETLEPPVDEAVDIEQLVDANVIYMDLPGDSGPVAVSILKVSDENNLQDMKVVTTVAGPSSEGIFEEHDPESQTTVLILDLDHKPDVSCDRPVVLAASPYASTACLGLLHEFCSKPTD